MSRTRQGDLGLDIWPPAALLRNLHPFSYHRFIHVKSWQLAGTAREVQEDTVLSSIYTKIITNPPAHPQADPQQFGPLQPQMSPTAVRFLCVETEPPITMTKMRSIKLNNAISPGTPLGYPILPPLSLVNY